MPSVRISVLATIGALLVLTPASTKATDAWRAPIRALDDSRHDAAGIAVASLTEAAAAAGLRATVLEAGLDGYRRALKEGVGNPSVLTVIDYSLPSREPRLWILDLHAGTVLARELVAHGRGSGLDEARTFSNVPGSLQSSIGTFITGATYRGKHGLSLRLNGIDAGLNDRAAERAIVMHGAWYVSEKLARQQGRLGRSEGCPALDEDVAPRVIELIRDGTVLFSYFPSPELEQAASAGP